MPSPVRSHQAGARAPNDVDAAEAAPAGISGNKFRGGAPRSPRPPNPVTAAGSRAGGTKRGTTTSPSRTPTKTSAPSSVGGRSTASTAWHNPPTPSSGAPSSSASSSRGCSAPTSHCTTPTTCSATGSKATSRGTSTRNSDSASCGLGGGVGTSTSCGNHSTCTSSPVARPRPIPEDSFFEGSPVGRRPQESLSTISSRSFSRGAFGTAAVSPLSEGAGRAGGTAKGKVGSSTSSSSSASTDRVGKKKNQNVNQLSSNTNSTATWGRKESSGLDTGEAVAGAEAQLEGGDRKAKEDEELAIVEAAPPESESSRQNASIPRSTSMQEVQQRHDSPPTALTTTTSWELAYYNFRSYSLRKKRPWALPLSSEQDTNFYQSTGGFRPNTELAEQVDGETTSETADNDNVGQEDASPVGAIGFPVMVGNGSPLFSAPPRRSAPGRDLVGSALADLPPGGEGNFSQPFSRDGRLVFPREGQKLDLAFFGGQSCSICTRTAGADDVPPASAGRSGTIAVAASGSEEQWTSRSERSNRCIATDSSIDGHTTSLNQSSSLSAQHARSGAAAPRSCSFQMVEHGGGANDLKDASISWSPSFHDAPFPLPSEPLGGQRTQKESMLAARHSHSDTGTALSCETTADHCPPPPPTMVSSCATSEVSENDRSRRGSGYEGCDRREERQTHAASCASSLSSRGRQDQGASSSSTPLAGSSSDVVQGSCSDLQSSSGAHCNTGHLQHHVPPRPGMVRKPLYQPEADSSSRDYDPRLGCGIKTPRGASRRHQKSKCSSREEQQRLRAGGSSSSSSPPSTTVAAPSSFSDVDPANASFEFGPLKGRGGSAEVYEVYDDRSRKFAMKVVSAKHRRHLDGFLEEVRLLERFSKKGSEGARDHIVRMYLSRCFPEQLQLYILLEFAECDFGEFLRRFEANGGMDVDTIYLAFLQMLQAVDVIHAAGIVHFDLKPANFLLVKPGRIKLSDFGLARALEDGATHISRHGQCGTVRYMPPEAFYQPEHSQSTMKMKPTCDVWSLGIILFQMMYLQTPFERFESCGNRVMFAIADPRMRVCFPILPKRLRMDPKTLPPTPVAADGAAAEEDAKEESADEPNMGQKTRINMVSPVVQHMVACLQGCLRHRPGERMTTAQLLQTWRLLEAEASNASEADPPGVSRTDSVSTVHELLAAPAAGAGAVGPLSADSLRKLQQQDEVDPDLHTFCNFRYQTPDGVHDDPRIARLLQPEPYPAGRRFVSFEAAPLPAASSVDPQVERALRDPSFVEDGRRDLMPGGGGAGGKGDESRRADPDVSGGAVFFGEQDPDQDNKEDGKRDHGGQVEDYDDLEAGLPLLKKGKKHGVQDGDMCEDEETDDDEYEQREREARRKKCLRNPCFYVIIGVLAAITIAVSAVVVVMQRKWARAAEEPSGGITIKR